MFIDLTAALTRLHSRRLVLRPVCLSDAWPLYSSTRNPVFNQHLAWEAPRDLDAVVQRVSAIMTGVEQGRLAAVSAATKATGAWVALFRFLPWKEDDRAIELGIWTHTDYWHGRYSLELGGMCVDAAFAVTTADKVVGLSLPENKSSCRLMELVGMSESGHTVRYSESGRRLEVAKYELTRRQWEISRSKALRYHELTTDLLEGELIRELEKGYRIVDEAATECPSFAAAIDATCDRRPVLAGGDPSIREYPA